MAREFRLPDVGEGLTEAEIVSWRIAVGGEVAADQPLVEVETDKAVVEIPSPFAGVVLRHGAAPGEVLEVGQVLVVIGEAGENGDSADAPRSRESPRPSGQSAAPIVGTLVEEAQDLTRVVASEAVRAPRPQAVPNARLLAKELGVDLATVVGSGSGGRILAVDVETAAARAAAVDSGSAARHTGWVLSPLVRRLATERGVDTRTLTGSGAGGRITRHDVLEAAELAGVNETGAAAARVVAERRPLSRMRRTIAANLSRSWSEIPQVTAFDEIDATRLLVVRRALQSRYDQAMPIDALLVAAVVPALEAFPEMNASLDGDHLVIHGRLDIGVAVATPDGLVVAALRDAGSKDVRQLAAEITDLGERARTRSLAVDELSGQTFTVSNVGAVGGGHGTPLVPAGTIGILSVGRATDKAVAREGRVVVASVMPLSLSYDHRIIDGAVGRRFLAALIENLAEPALLLGRG